MDSEWDVVVCGAGMAGSACALALAEEGLSILLLNSALDTVGLPTFGPVLRLGDRGFGALSCLPVCLSDVILRCSRVTRRPYRPGDAEEEGATGSGPSLGSCMGTFGRDPLPYGGVPPGAEARTDTLVLDRRALSIELKLLLEEAEGVDLRQAIVVGVGAPEGGEPAGSVVVRTVFEDRFVARACLISVGMGLGGRVLMGKQSLEGGRYGEVSADLLLGELRTKGYVVPPVRCVETRVPVGPSLVGAPLDRLHEPETRAKIAQVLSGCWGEPSETMGLVFCGQPVADGAQLSGGPSLSCGQPRHMWSGRVEAGIASYVARYARGKCGREGVVNHGDDDEDPGFVKGPFDQERAHGTRCLSEAWHRGERWRGESACFKARGDYGDSSVDGGDERARKRLFVPDGIASGEWFLSPGSDTEPLAELGIRVSRPEHVVRGCALMSSTMPLGHGDRSVEERARMGGDGSVARLAEGMWVAGRAAGARDYLETLKSGYAAASCIAAYLSEHPGREGVNWTQR